MQDDRDANKPNNVDDPDMDYSDYKRNDIANQLGIDLNRPGEFGDFE